MSEDLNLTQELKNGTKLLNIDKEIPQQFYILVDMNNPITKHNIERTGGFSSGAVANWYLPSNFRSKYFEGTVNYLPFILNMEHDFGGISMFCNNITSDYRVEYNCELYRKSKFKFFPSRFSTLYAFDSWNTCLEVQKKYKWWGCTAMPFKLEPGEFNRVIRVNMEIISLCRYLNNRMTLDSEIQNTIWNHYWSGKGDIKIQVDEGEIVNSGIIWEYLIEGRLTLIESKDII